MKRILIVLGLIGLSLSAFYVIKSTPAKYASNPVAIAPEKTFQEVQDALNKDYCKRKIVSRFEVVEGLHGLDDKDISLTLLEYSYHHLLNVNDRRQPFVTVRCRIDIGKFEHDAALLRERLGSTGGQLPVNIELPDTERTILGLLDEEKVEFITFASLPKSVKPMVQFAELRKNKPEYMIITVKPDEQFTEYRTDGFTTEVIGFNTAGKTYDTVLEVKTHRSPDKYSITWSDWIKNEYRELIVSTDNEVSDPKGAATATFKNKKEVYTWINDNKLVLVERIVDGKTTMSRRENLQSPIPEITLKDGELYETNGNGSGAKLTSTGGKVSGYLVSPDKHFVAYSFVVGEYKVVGEDGEGDARPVSHIGVMDLDEKKQLTVIEPQSENKPFIYADRWISNEDLILTEADGFATGLRYVYNAETNEVRTADIPEMNL